MKDKTLARKGVTQVVKCVFWFYSDVRGEGLERIILGQKKPEPGLRESWIYNRSIIILLCFGSFLSLSSSSSPLKNKPLNFFMAWVSPL